MRFLPFPIITMIVVSCTSALALFAAPPVFPPQVRATLVGHCYSFDAFNCPDMYIGRSFSSMAYFDYAGQRLREDDLFSVNGSAASYPSINFERVYGANLNATHVSITLFYILSNETRTPLQCVAAVYPGQMNRQNFMENATLIRRNALVPGRSENITADMWLVNVPPAYYNVLFYTGPLSSTSEYSRVYRIEARDGSYYVNYFQFEGVVIASDTLTPPFNC
jgi:hypothetical protein